MSDTPVNLSRRHFTRSLGASAIALCGLETLAQEKESEKQDSPPEADAPDWEKAEKLPEEDELLIQVLALKVPHSRLTPQILKLIQADIRGDLQRSQILSSFPLKNWDEPATRFTAWRQDQPY